MFPYNDTPLQKKELEEYALKCATNISGMANNKKIERQKEHYQKNILYIEALQSNDTYNKYINKNISVFGESRINTNESINTSPIGIIRLIYKSIYARIDKIATEICVEGKDVKTLKEREDYIKDIRNRKKLAPIVEDITGIDPSVSVKDITEEDLEILEMMGVPTLYESLYERLLKTTDEYNEIRDYIIPYINHSLICAGFCGTYLSYDSNGIVTEEPILPNEVKVIGGTKQDYSDADAFIITKKINYNELMSYYIKNNITEDKAKQLKSIADSDGNVEVEIMYWSAVSFIPKKKIIKEDKIIGLRKHGEKYTADYVITIHNWYSCYYIKGVNMVVNFGSIKNMPRVKSKNGNVLSFCPVNIINSSSVYESDTTPIISVIAKFEDMANIAFQKLQNELAGARASGYNINLAALNDAVSMLKDENVSLKHADLIKLKLQTGIGISSHKDSFENPTQQQAFIYEEGGLSKAYIEFMNVINMAIDWCYKFSGTPVVDTGVQQDYRVSNYVTQGIQEGADKAIIDLIKAKDLYLIKSAEKKLNMIMSIYSLSYEDNPYRNILNEFENMYLDDIDISSRQLFIKLEKSFTEKEEKELMEMASAGLQQYLQTGGAEGISQVEYILFKELFKDNKKLANIKLAYILNKKKKEKLAESSQMQQQNAMIQQQSNEQANMNKMMELKVESELDKNKKDLEIRNKTLELVVKGEVEKGTNSQEIIALISSALQPLEQLPPEPTEQQTDMLPETQTAAEQDVAI